MGGIFGGSLFSNGPSSAQVNTQSDVNKVLAASQQVEIQKAEQQHANEVAQRQALLQSQAASAARALALQRTKALSGSAATSAQIGAYSVGKGTVTRGTFLGGSSASNGVYLN